MRPPRLAPKGNLAKADTDSQLVKMLAETQKTLAKLAADNATLQRRLPACPPSRSPARAS